MLLQLYSIILLKSGWYRRGHQPLCHGRWIPCWLRSPRRFLLCFRRFARCDFLRRAFGGAIQAGVYEAALSSGCTRFKTGRTLF